MIARILPKLLGIVFTVFTVWYSFYIITPPEAQPASAPPSLFSAERAFKHIQYIASSPRPLGSKANDSTRAYLMRQLRDMGLQPVIQEGVGMGDRHTVAGYTRNILAKLPGSNSQKIIMLMAHYDSVPIGPGAGDDASGVSTILEVIRALRAGDPIQDDILILFTDGEERGLLGAELFVDRFTDLEEIELVINMEARGTGGPSIMFETSKNNAGLIPHLAAAATRPVANSLSYTIYTLLPNDTDLTVMKRAGLNGLNYAIIDGYLDYHTLQDTPENISLNSLQHHGENLLSNTRYFANNSMNTEGKSDYVYFNNLTGGIAYYPAGWSFPLAAFTGLIFIGYLILLFRKRHLRVLQYLLGIISWLLILVTGALLTYYGWQLIREIHPEYQWLVQGETYNHEWYLFGFTFLVLALVTASTNWLLYRLRLNELLSGIYTIWISLGIIAGWYLPTASYLLTWPALFGLLGWMSTEPGSQITDWKSRLLLWLSLLPLLFIIPPYIKLVQVAMTTNFLAVCMVLLILTAGLCLPLLRQIINPRAGYWAGGFIALFIICTVGAALNSGYDVNHKKQNSLMYLADLDRNTAYWASRDHTTDSWTSQFVDDTHADTVLPWFSNSSWSSGLLLGEAPILSFAPAVFQIKTDSIADTLRYLTIDIRSEEPGTGMFVNLSGNQSFRELSVAGEKWPLQQAVDETRSPINGIFYFADITELIELDMVLSPQSTDIALEITFINHELPEKLMESYDRREPHMMPAPIYLSDATIWKKTYRLNTINE